MSESFCISKERNLNFVRFALVGALALTSVGCGVGKAYPGERDENNTLILQKDIDCKDIDTQHPENAVVGDTATRVNITLNNGEVWIGYFKESDKGVKYSSKLSGRYTLYKEGAKIKDSKALELSARDGLLMKSVGVVC